MLKAVLQGLSDIEDEERRIWENAGENFDMILKTNIEGIIVKWAHQVDTSPQPSWTNTDWLMIPGWWGLQSGEREPAGGQSWPDGWDKVLGGEMS